MSAVKRVTSRFSATPAAVAKAGAVSAPCAICVKRSKANAANKAFEAMKP
ncbi:MAG TPA: hypothetical protein VMI72_09180 [Roseiarcus sp.]|nr:hypothetical protein [Roseiarcus sp.]